MAAAFSTRERRAAAVSGSTVGAGAASVNAAGRQGAMGKMWHAGRAVAGQPRSAADADGGS